MFCIIIILILLFFYYYYIFFTPVFFDIDQSKTTIFISKAINIKFRILFSKAIFSFRKILISDMKYRKMKYSNRNIMSSN